LVHYTPTSGALAHDSDLSCASQKFVSEVGTALPDWDFHQKLQYFLEPTADQEFDHGIPGSNMWFDYFLSDSDNEYLISRQNWISLNGKESKGTKSVIETHYNNAIVKEEIPIDK